MEYQNRVESHRFGVQQAKELGRYKGVGGRQLESIDEFFDKPKNINILRHLKRCLLYTSPSPRDLSTSRMPSSA